MPGAQHVHASIAAAPRLPRLAAMGGALALCLLSAQPQAAGEAAAEPEGGSSTPTLGTALRASTSEQLALSEHLRRSGALFYGAWWCPACFKQKNLFGQEAGDQLPYVECAKTQAGRDRCQAAGIKAYPTWILGERRIEGVQTLEELKRWSGFSGTSAAD
jgi:hypothetical protein